MQKKARKPLQAEGSSSLLHRRSRAGHAFLPHVTNPKSVTILRDVVMVLRLSLQFTNRGTLRRVIKELGV